MLLPEPRDAFAARILLAATAEKSLDAQYYIWHGDQVGYLAVPGALAGGRARRARAPAARRPEHEGSRSRPSPRSTRIRTSRCASTTRSSSATAARAQLPDRLRAREPAHAQQVVHRRQPGDVVGGRNIGNEYFGAGDGLGSPTSTCSPSGAAVRDVSREFDLYWNSASAYPAAGFVGPPPPDGTAATARPVRGRPRADPESVAYLEAVRATPLMRELLDAHARARVDDRRASCTTTRPRRSTPSGAHRRAALPGARAQDGPAGEDARHRLAVLRAGRRRHRAAGGTGASAA